MNRRERDAPTHEEGVPGRAAPAVRVFVVGYTRCGLCGAVWDHAYLRVSESGRSGCEAGDVVAITDWEIGTLGDLLADITYFLLGWGDELASSADAFLDARRDRGYATHRELFGAYESRPGRKIELFWNYHRLQLFEDLLHRSGRLRPLSGRRARKPGDGSGGDAGENDPTRRCDDAIAREHLNGPSCPFSGYRCEMESTSRIRVNGIEIEYAEQGAGDRAFLLVHGFTGSRDDWREQTERLAKKGRTVLIDQRGHGGSENPGRPDAYHLDILRDDLAEAIDRLGIRGCDLLGHSMGGMVALRLALVAPERISSLILMDTAAHGIDLVPEAMFDASIRIVESQGMSGLAKIMREGARNNPHSAPSTLRAIEKMGFDPWWARIDRKLEQMDPVAFTTLGRALAAQTDLRARLSEIRCPTTVIVGEEDAPFRAPSEELAHGIDGAVLRMIPNAAHSPQLENADAWRSAIFEHLERVRETDTSS